MNSGRLVPRQVVTKNGVLTTRWTKEDTYFTSSRHTPIPSPVASPESKLPRGAVKEMRDIRAATTDRLKATYDALVGIQPYRSYERYTEGLAALRSAFENREYDKMKVLGQHLSLTTEPEVILRTFDHLQAREIDNIPEIFTNEAWEDFQNINFVLTVSTIGGPPPTIKPLSRDERLGLANHAAELIFTRPGSADKVYDLIVERGITDPDNLTATLDESEGYSNAVFGGVL